MRVVRLRKKCMVRGCGNLETYAISRGWGETGNVFICEGCLKEALEGISDAKERYAKKVEEQKTNAEKPLFYHPELVKKEVTEAVDEKVDEKVDDIEKSVDADEPDEDVITETKCICTECGKEFDTVKGLTSHIARVHKE